MISYHHAYKKKYFRTFAGQFNPVFISSCNFREYVLQFLWKLVFFSFIFPLNVTLWCRVSSWSVNVFISAAQRSQLTTFSLVIGRLSFCFLSSASHFSWEHNVFLKFVFGKENLYVFPPRFVLRPSLTWPCNFVFSGDVLRVLRHVPVGGGLMLALCHRSFTHT